MKFKIVGCRKDTGEDVQVVIEAPNAQWAEKMAQQKGILTSSVEAAPVAAAPPPGQVLVAKRVSPKPKVAPPPPPPPPQEEVPLEEDLVSLTDIPEDQLGGAEVQPVYSGPVGPVVVEKEEEPRGSRGFSIGLPMGMAGPLFSLIGVLGLAFFLWIFNQQAMGEVPVASFSSFKSHAPPGSNTFIYLDVASLRKSPAWENFEPLMESIFEESPIDLHQVDQVMYALHPDEKVALILKTTQDLHISDLTGVEGRTTKFEGVTYTENKVAEGGEWIARVARQLYVITTHEDLMQAAIKASRTGGGGKSSPELERVSTYVGTADHVAVMDGGALQERSDKAKGLKAAGLGLSIRATSSSRLHWCATRRNRPKRSSRCSMRSKAERRRRKRPPTRRPSRTRSPRR